MASFWGFRVHIVNNFTNFFLHKLAYETDLLVSFFKHAWTFRLFRRVKRNSFHSIAGGTANSNIHFIIEIRFLNPAVNKRSFLAHLMWIGSKGKLRYFFLNFPCRVPVSLRFLKELMFVLSSFLFFFPVIVRLLIVTVQIKVISRRCIIAII